MKIGIYVNIKKKHLLDILNIILSEFSDPQYELIFLNKQKHINKLINISDYLKNKDDNYDILLSIGGVETILCAIRSQYKRQKPILGIHVGRLGFLAEADIDNCKTIFKSIKNSKYQVESRSLFKITIINNSIKKEYICANDIVIDRGKSARIIGISPSPRWRPSGAALEP